MTLVDVNMPIGFQIFGYAMLLAYLLPFVQILPDHGLSQWWALLALVPYFGLLVLLWLIAIKSYRTKLGAK